MEKIKISSIREKFPMYGDLNDEQLVIGIRKKYYPDIPIGKFAEMIDFDTQRQKLMADAAEEGGFLAGVGKGMTDVAQGIGQVLGLQSREDVKAKRAMDEALSNTFAGKAGSVVGNIAALAPTVFIPGAATLPGAAAIGAGTGLLAPSESTSETIKNTGIGTLAGPGGVLAGRALGAGASAVSGLMQPFTQKGQEKIAASTLQQFASNPQTAAANLRSAQTLVPGSAPTMAQASGDAGLAQMERTLVNNPETGPALTAQYAAQRAARLGAIGDLAGDPAKRATAVAARETATGDLYKQATRAVYQADDKFADLMSRPVMQQAMQRAQRLATNQGRPPVQFTTQTNAPFAGVGGPQAQTRAQITGQGLQDLKMALDDMLSDPMAGIGKNEANAVKAVRAQLIDWMEGANPAFKQARTTFAQQSVPINTMDVAQALMDKLQPALARYGANSREQAQAYAQALEAAKDTVKKQTGINKPIDEVIDAQALKILNNIAKDLGRKAAAEDAGRAVGSNTAQNLAAQNLLRRTLGPTGLPQSWAESTALQTFLSPYTGLTKLAGSERAVMDRLSRAALDPNDAAGLLTMAQQPSRMGLLGQQSLRYAPSLLLGYTGQ